MVIILVFEVCN